MWIRYERLHNHDKAKHNKTVCIFLGIYCIYIHIYIYMCVLQLLIHALTSTAIFINTLRPRQNGRHFADDIFKCIFSNENAWISLKFSLKFVPKGPINNNPALVQIMAWRRSGDKPLSEPMMIGLPTHICVTRPQWVKPSLIIGVMSTYIQHKRMDVIIQPCLNFA